MTAQRALRSPAGEQRIALPVSTPDAEGIFGRALAALSLCADVAVAGGSTAARSYVSGAAGALRHALEILALEGRILECGSVDEEFETRRVGTSELVGGADGWDTTLRCGMPDGSVGTARALWPAPAPEDGIWTRPDGELPGLWTRGRLELSDIGVTFVDEPDRDRRPEPAAIHDLGGDLVRSGLTGLASRPALARALEVTLSSGSWCHAASRSRWFGDDATARAVVRMLGGTSPVEPSTRARLRGLVDREALLAIERAGWRHVPTPRFDD